MQISHDPIEYERDLIRFVVDNRHIYGVIPEYMTEGVMRWVLYGIKPGDFLTAVIRNAPFIEVMEKADDANAICLRAWAAVMVNMVPAICRGSAEAMSAWIAKGGILGIERAKQEQPSDALTVADKKRHA